MVKNIPIPPSFSFIKKGKVFLLLKDEYKDLLLQQEIDNPDHFLKRHQPGARYVQGRTPHLSVPISDKERIVVRHYSHGGLLRVLNRNLYLMGARSLRELALTEEIRSCGISTIQPIGAIHHRVLPPFYQAYLLSLEIPDAVDLVQHFQELGLHPTGGSLKRKRNIIRSVGLLLQKFHAAGFFHRDLQLKNILVKEDQPFLIDFDRSYRRAVLSRRERIENLLRLNRSAEKWKRLGLHVTRTDRWRLFLAYTGNDQEVREEMRRILRSYSLRLLLHRCWWALSGK